jgi:hypothetical protein
MELIFFKLSSELRAKLAAQARRRYVAMHGHP